jgi:hypothetical protein
VSNIQQSALSEHRNTYLEGKGKEVKLMEAEIRGLCMKAREIFLSQPMLLELEAPIKICGIASLI